MRRTPTRVSVLPVLAPPPCTSSISAPVTASATTSVTASVTTSVTASMTASVTFCEQAATLPPRLASRTPWSPLPLAHLVTFYSHQKILIIQFSSIQL
ncbi:hypothetical protein L211DRAFT_260828 [Terfezia boudieri ATCC MYA-4762]|uniref:Uncharacterized protein n=1 Tax=Terfezia boudieri ATCC MYA-4762 TaxID=1051890 RepID=A0A3N4M1W5_9PEZI|nr:hypothetical protein L211DRAFT_260828 [Terfezia boudieri ATCC MYA-4762]